MPRTPRLVTVHRLLRAHHGMPPAPPVTDPFGLVLWEQVAYLATDSKRLAAFRELERRVGLTPAEVAAARQPVLEEIASRGGSIAADTRAERMAASARRVLEHWGGRLDAVLDLPPDKALRELGKFPMIGKPGAEKILLLSGAHAVLALDSNGLRVLLRLGYGEDTGRYDRTYAAVRAATAPEEQPRIAWLAELHGLLRVHGQTLCRNSRPACGRCPVRASCDHAAGESGD